MEVARRAVLSELKPICESIRWHLARHREWGDRYWMHPMISEEVDYEMYQCLCDGRYFHWCGDRDFCDRPYFVHGLSSYT